MTERNPISTPALPGGLPFDATQIQFTPAGAGAVARPVQAKDREIVSITDFFLTGVMTTDVQAAIDKTSAAGQFLYVPAATYTFLKGPSQTDEAGTTFPCLTMRSNMHIWAEPGAVFKLADNQSTDGTPINLAMFFSNGVLSNISIRNLTIDMNGANNKISPNRGTLTYNRFTFAHILFSGTPAGVAARGTDIFLGACTFKNTPGVTCIGLAQSNTNSVVLGKRWTIRDCLFNNNGTDTDDHSSIYAWADDALVDGNTFTADTMWNDTTKVGPLVACELHGADQRFVNNKINNYFQGLWIGANQTSAVQDVIVSDNSMTIAATAIAFARATSPGTMQAVTKVKICDNFITLTDDAVAPLALKTAFDFENVLAVSDVTMDGNEIYTAGTTVGSAALFILASGTAAQKNTGIVFKNNKVKGLTLGIEVITSATNGVGTLEVGGNQFLNLTAAGAEGTARGIVIIVLPTAMDQLVLHPNTFIDDRGGTAFNNGIIVGNGTITTYHLGLQSYRGIVVNYFEATLVTTKRTGLAASPATITAATYTVLADDVSIIANRAGTVTLTLENPVTVGGKILVIRTIQAQTVVSAGSNVVPLVGGAAGTAILAATAGKWATLQSDGTNWQIMAGN